MRRFPSELGEVPASEYCEMLAHYKLEHEESERERKHSNNKPKIIRGRRG